MDAYCGKAEGNATKAAELAGYSVKSAARIGYRLSKKVHVQSAIVRRQAAREERTEIGVDRVLAELAAVAFSDVRALFQDNGALKPVHELSESVAKAVASVEITKVRTKVVGEVSQEEWVSKVRQWDKLRALEMISRLQGFFPSEKHDHNHSGAVTLAALLGVAVAHE